MGSTYTLNFPINAGDPGPLRNIATAAEQIGAKLKISAGEMQVFEAGFKSLTASGMSAAEALKQLTIPTDTLGKNINTLARETLAATTAERGLEAASRSLGDTLKGHTVPQIAATSAAIRTLEGGNSIRAVEQLLTKTLGLGGAFQAAFPLIGATAMVEVIGRMTEKVVELYNAWDPVTKAEKTMVETIKEANQEYERLLKQKRQYEIQEIGRVQGPAAAEREKAKDAASSAGLTQVGVNTLVEQRKQLEQVIAAPAKFLDELAKHPQYGDEGTTAELEQLNRAADAARLTLRGLDAKIKTESFSVEVDKAAKDAHTATAAEEDKRKALEAANKLREHQDQVIALIDGLDSKAVAPLAKFLQDANRRIIEITQRGLPFTAAESGRIGGAFQAGYAALRAKEGVERADVGDRSFEYYHPFFESGTAMGFDKESERQRTEDLHRNEENILRNARALRELGDRNREMDVRLSDRALEAATRSAVATGTAGLYGAARITTAGQIELAGAQQQRDSAFERIGELPNKSLADMTSEDFKKLEDAAKASYEYKQKEAEIQESIVQKLQQERDAQSDRLSASFTGSMDSLLEAVMKRTPGVHQSHGTLIEQLGRSWAMDLSSHFIQGISEMFLFNKSGTGILDKALPNFANTPFAPLFKRTPLDRIGAKNPNEDLATDTVANTDATRLNTDAINSLTARLGGRPTGPVPGGASISSTNIGGAVTNVGGAMSTVENLYRTISPGGTNAGSSVSGGGTSISLAGLFGNIAGSPGTIPSVSSAISYPSIGDYAASPDSTGDSPFVSERISFPQIGNAYTDTSSGAASYGSAIADLATSPTITPGSDLAAIALGGGINSAAVSEGTPNFSITSGSGAASLANDQVIAKAAVSAVGATGALLSIGSTNAGNYGLPGPGFIGGLTGSFGGNGPLAQAITGVARNADGSAAENLSGAQQIGAGLGAAGVIATGMLTAMQQFSRGGAKGDLGGTSAILGTAAVLDPEPISKAVLGAVSAITGLVGSVIGNTKQKRQNWISTALFNNQYQAPEAINVSSSTTGGYADINSMGNLRTSSLSPYPTVEQGYKDLPYRFAVPGEQTSQFGGGAAPTTIINNNVTQRISAMDSQSFETFAKKNGPAFATGVANGLNQGHTPLTNALNRVLGNS